MLSRIDLTRPARNIDSNLFSEIRYIVPADDRPSLLAASDSFILSGDAGLVPEPILISNIDSNLI